jgi:hypothetical protein
MKYLWLSLLILISITNADSYSIGTKWPKNNLTWRLINDLPNNNYQTLSAIFEKAFKKWSDVANITFTQTSGSTYNISIEFVPFDIETLWDSLG